MKAAIISALLLAVQVALADHETVLDTTFKTLIRCGDVRPNAQGVPVTLGAIVDSIGRPLLDARGRPIKSGNTDFTTYWDLPGLPTGLRSIVQLEDFNAPYQALDLEMDCSGNLRVSNIHYVNMSAWESSIRPCAGSKTPWMTHMGGEEQCPDVRAITQLLNTRNLASVVSNNDVRSLLNWKGIYIGSGNTTNDAALRTAVRNMGATYLEANDTATWFRAFATQYKPYMIGHLFEINPQTLAFSKHLGLGRATWELGIVMPDNRTVYLSDDATAGGLLKFVANRPSDMSKGVMYAAKFTQLNADDSPAGNWNIRWIKMADIDQSIVAVQARKSLTDFNFDHIFVSVAMTNNTCPAGFVRVDWQFSECLNLNMSTPNVEMLAAALETRRYIPYVGATTEFSKMEGMTFDATNPTKLYVAISYQRRLMTTALPARPGQNDVRVQENLCGCTYVMDLDSSYSTTNMYPLICGQPIRINGTAWCNLTMPGNPDNLDMMDGFNQLIISEDSDYRLQNFLWAYNTQTNKYTLIGASEEDTEVTAGWYTELRGWSYITANYQGAPDSPMGYLGPWDLTNVKNVAFAPHTPMGEEYMNPYATFNGVTPPTPKNRRRALIESGEVHLRMQETVKARRGRRMARHML